MIPLGRILLIASTLGPVLFAGVAAAQGRSDRTGQARHPTAADWLDAAAIERAARELMTSKKVASYSIGVVRDDDLLYAISFGVADRRNRTAATPDTLYQVGSITKLFTATLAGILHDRKELGLDDRVVKHLPPAVARSAPAWLGQTTVRHLLTHTAGLPKNPPNRKNLLDTIWKPYSIEELYDAFGKTEPIGAVGGQWSYSNYGFALLGHVLERAAGEPYEALMKRRLLDPLGMQDTRITLAADDEKRLAKHYWPEDTPQKERPRWRFGEVSGFGGLTSNVRDLAKFVSLQFRAGDGQSPPIRGRTLQRLHAPQRPIKMRGRDLQMGLGWFIMPMGGPDRILVHGGEVDGHSAFIAFNPARRVGVIVLANLGGDAAPALGERLIAVVLSKAPRPAG